MFVGLHVALAGLTGYEELLVTDDEASNFMTAAQNVLRHYSITTTQKTLDTVAFIGAAAGIYIPRLYLIAQKRKHPPVQRPAANGHDPNAGLVVTGPFNHPVN